MKVYLDQIPEGYRVEDYPEGTEFVLVDDSRPERDPQTYQLIPRQKRPLIYPQSIRD